MKQNYPPSGVILSNVLNLRPLPKSLFLLPALPRIRKCSFTIEYAAFAAELKKKHAVFGTRSQVMQNS